MPELAEVAATGRERLKIRLFGTCEFIVDGESSRVLEAPRFQRFFAMVLLFDGALRRSRLAFKLWPDSTESQARTNLRKLLHDLRRLVPDIDTSLEIGKDFVRWKHSRVSAADVLGFRNALSVGDFGRAALLYKGDFLPDRYDDWILDERERFRAEAHKVFGRLVEQAAVSGDHATVVEKTKRLLELDPSDEGAIRHQINALVSLGDNSAARRAYRNFAESLAREFGARPSVEIATLYKTLPTTEPVEQLDANHPVSADALFLGRRLELNSLAECWQRAVETKPMLALVTGEPGIGKSRLALEFSNRVAAEGFAVASTRAYQVAGTPPWGPIIELLRSPALAGQLARIDPHWRAELARLLPELGAAGQPDDNGQSGRVAQRHRLLDAIRQGIAGDGAPRLLIVDDLQWCDAETIECLGFLVWSNPKQPLLIVGTLRAEEIEDNHPVAGLINSLERERAITTITLGRFNRSDTELLAKAMGGGVDASNLEQLWAETDGNPLFIVETLRAGLQPNEGVLALSPTMRAVLSGRLKKPSIQARRVIELAAVFGRPFSVEGMCAALKSDEREVVACLEELWRRQILREHGTRYDFSHDKLREAALELITPVRRRQLHKAVAQAIAASDGAGALSNSAHLAAHYDQAGLVEPAIGAYREAGARAVLVSALGEAVSLYERATKLLADLPDSADRDEIELDLRLSLGSPLVAVKGYGSEDAHRLYERALSLCRRLGRTVDAPILRGLGLARLQGCRFADCDRLAQQLVGLGEADSVALTEGYYLLGVSAFWQGQLSAAEAQLERAVTSYKTGNRNRHLEYFAQDPQAICLVRLSLAQLWLGDPAKADKTARAALETAVDIDHLMSIGYVLTYSAILATEAEDYGRLKDLLDEAENQWKRLSDRYLSVVLDAIRGWLEVREGTLGGIDQIVAAVERSRAGAESLHLTFALLLLARARALRGELGDAEAAVRKATAYSAKTGQHYLIAPLLQTGGSIARQRGDAADARRQFLEAVSVARDQGALWHELRARTSLVTADDNHEFVDGLRALMGRIPSGHELPAFRAAKELLG